MICFPVTRHVGGCRVSARKAWGHHVATARRRFEREDDVGPRRRIARVARGPLGGAPRRGARRTKSVLPRKTRERREHLGNEESAGSAHLPDHLIGLHGGRSPGPLAEGRSRPTRSRARARECSRGRARAGSSSVRNHPRRPWQPPTKLFTGRDFRRAVWPCFANILVRASNVSAHRGWGTTDRSTAHEAFRSPATRTPSRASREFARGVSRTDPG